MCEALLETWLNIEILWKEGSEATLNHYGKVLSAEEQNRLQHALNGNIEDNTEVYWTKSLDWMFEERGAYEDEDYYGDPLEGTQLLPQDKGEPSLTEELKETLYEETKEETPFPGEEHETKDQNKSEEGDKETSLVKGEYKEDYYRDPITETCFSQNVEAGPLQVRKQKETLTLEREYKMEYHDDLEEKKEKISWKERLELTTKEQREELKKELRAMGFIEKPRETLISRVK